MGKNAQLGVADLAIVDEERGQELAALTELLKLFRSDLVLVESDRVGLPRPNRRDLALPRPAAGGGDRRCRIWRRNVGIVDAASGYKHCGKEWREEEKSPHLLSGRVLNGQLVHHLANAGFKPEQCRSEIL